MRKVRDTGRRIAEALKITGPFNIQFIAKDNALKVIECNLRASRSFPFVSKVSKVNFVDLAVEAMMGRNPKCGKTTLDLNYVGVKAPQFSFSRLKGADPTLGVEMASTGEVACLGEDVQEAFLKSLLSAGYTLPKKGILLSIGNRADKLRFLESARTLHGVEASRSSPPSRPRACWPTTASPTPSFTRSTKRSGRTSAISSPRGKSISSSRFPTRSARPPSTAITKCGGWPSTFPSPC